MALEKALIQRISTLSPSQREDLAKRLRAQLSATQAVQKLVAYVVPRPHTIEPDPGDLRNALKAKLPQYMVPSVIVPLKAIPRNANGKVDAMALPVPQPVSQSTELAAPKTATEETLIRIWCTVLGLNDIGLHDNFFELGGDSILSIQIVSQAREAGLRIVPNQLFEQPTVAELAAVVNLTAEVMASQEPVTGSVALTPIQHWFFDQEMAVPQHWHQAMLLELPDRATISSVEGAIATLYRHHDALRLSFHASPTGWQQICTAPGDPPPLTHVNLSSLSESEQTSALVTHGHHLHGSLNLSEGKLLQTAYFTRGHHQPNWLLLSLHHLAVDAVSWQILHRDFSILLTQPHQPLPPKTTAFQAWSETLTAQAHQQAADIPYWLHQVESPVIRLPRDFPAALPMTEASARRITVSLDASDTQTLLHTVPAVYNTQINDVLLTVLAQTLLPWAGVETGSLRVEVEAHGREAIAQQIDVSQTVGWFTLTYPLRLQLCDSDPGAALKSIKEQLRQVPNRGIGYGLLRYLGEDSIRQRLAQAAPSELLFNYLGQRDRMAQNADLRLIQDLDVGPLRHPNNQRSYLLELNAWVADGQLQMNWTYDTQAHRLDSITALAHRYLRTLKATLAHCNQVDSGGFTPSDFPDADFEQSELDNFMAQQVPIDPKKVEAIYPLVPLQQAFLWHSLQTQVKAGLLHIRCRFHGEVDRHRLQQAWDIIVGRHPALRTSVHWEAMKQPLQVVAKQVSIPWQEIDYRTVENPQPALMEFLAADCDRNFTLTQAPILRLALIRFSEVDYELIWSCHHLMLDGWSGALVFNQVFDCYEQLGQGPLLAWPSAPTFQTYARWLKAQDQAGAAAFWRQALAGFTQITPLPMERPEVPGNSVDRLRDREQELASASLASATLEFSVEMSERVQGWLRSQRLTLNTLMQGLWALVLSHYSGETDVLFGATVSGRQIDLAGVEAIVGLLINVLPVRVQLSLEQDLLIWLHNLQTQQADASHHGSVSPAQIQDWSELSGRLFDSLLVIENYPIQAVRQARSLRVDTPQSGIVSTYGLTVIVKPGEALTVMLRAAANRFQETTLRAILDTFKTMLTTLVESPSQSIADYLPRLPLGNHPCRQQPTSRQGISPDLSRETLEGTFVAPRTPIELKLTQIWEAVLGVCPLSVDASFFDLGGDSLLAVQLFNQMQQQLNCTLPLSTLFQAPNVRQFAAVLSQSQHPSQPISPWSSLVPIQTRGSQQPFFFHGGSADALTWARFSHHLGPDQPFYALQRPDLDGGEITHTSVEALATDCLKELRMVQPTGPYLLGGHCFGGAVALEIAQQLQAQGEDITSLILIDAYRTGTLPDNPLIKLQTQLQMRYFWLQKNYYYHGRWDQLATLPTKLWQRLKPSKNKQPYAQATAHPIENTSTVSPAPGAVPYEYRYARAQQANAIASDHYLPRPYIGRTQLFRAQTQTLDWHFGPALGWQTVITDGLETTQIPGFFGNLFNQQSGPILAEQVKAYLLTIS